MNAKFSTLAVALSLALGLPMGGNLHAEEAASIDAALNIDNKPPTSDENQCFARVSVPAVYRTEEIKTETRAEVSRFTITPAVFENGVETVITLPEHQSIEAVQPEIIERAETVEIFPASQQWVRGSLEGNQPITKGEMADIAASGVDVGNVEPGTCLVEHFSEATLQDIPTKILVSEATERLSVEEAVLKEDTVSVITKPEFTLLVEVPPTYNDGVEKIQIASATKQWKTDCGAVQQVDHMTGETLCLVDVAAQFKEIPTKVLDVPALITEVNKDAETESVKIQVLVSDAKEVREAVAEEFDSIDRQRISKPAQYSWLVKGQKPAFGAKATGRTACFVDRPAQMAEYTRKVVKTPGRFIAKTIAEETASVEIEQMVSAASKAPYKEPATFETVERKIKVSDARIEWKPVLCQVNFSEDIISQVQEALVREGYEPGPIDGIMGRGTSNAISSYQKSNKLADGGLTIETLEKLGIKL